MHVIQARNVCQALPMGLALLRNIHTVADTRNSDELGGVLAWPEPVCTQYARPYERVLFHPVRDANPFFHLFEALWMLAGRNDVATVAFFNSRMRTFSDDGGGTLRGAYGHRWREWFSYDQLPLVINELRTSPNSRRAVLTMWDAGNVVGDLSSLPTGVIKDIPCNTHAYFDLRGGNLNMTVCNRSNDIFWGAYGANAVHLSLLQEYVACALGVPMGWYHQISNNFHIYTGVFDPRTDNRLDQPDDRYATAEVGWTTPLFDKGKEEKFDLALTNFFDGPPTWPRQRTDNAFLDLVALPLWAAWLLYKEKKYDSAIRRAEDCAASDWRLACTDWLRRREGRHAGA